MFIIYLTMMLVVIVTLVTFLLLVDINISPIETNTLSYTFLYSMNGFSYKNEEIQRNYPGVIDESKFNPDYLKGIIADQQHIAARFTLNNLEDKSKKTAYYNQEWFDRWYGLAITNLPGPGGAALDIKSVPVTITDSKMSKMQKGILTIEIVMPNS